MTFVTNPFALYPGDSFDPTSISGLALWLKADAITGKSDGDTIATWADSSGNGNDCTQSTSANRPIYKTNKINSKPAVRFSDNSVQKYLDIPSINYKTVFIVAKSDDAIAVNAPMLIGNVSSLIIGEFAAYHFLGRSPFGSGFSPDLVKHNGFTVGPQSLCYCDDMFPFDDFWCCTQRDSTGITHAASLGAYPNGDTQYNWQGDIAEVLVYSTVLNDDQIADVERYLLAKYNLPQTTYTHQHVYDGDSIPLGAIASMPFGYRLQPDLGKNWQYRNFAVGSQRTDQMQARQAATFASFNAGYARNILTVNIGTNDLTQSVSPTTAEGNLATWCADGRAVGFKVIVTTLVPNSNGGLPGGYDANRLTYNQRIRDNYTGYADVLVDLAGDTGLQVNPGDNYVDGTHFTAAGHTLVASLLKPVIQGLA